MKAGMVLLERSDLHSIDAFNLPRLAINRAARFSYHHALDSVWVQ